ncbi:MAG TPA: phospholipase D-like domain-containing protein [Ktedonobacteraceae bacterium]|nr:phospholipase D-like domain-containing protein [Ktedonobacteraceae bacterium]
MKDKALSLTITASVLLNFFCILALCCLLAACDVSVSGFGTSTSTGSQCQSNCTVGTGASGLGIIVEPDAGPNPIVDAIRGAKKSVWVEMYLLTNKSVIGSLEEAANRGIDVRVILEEHPYGGGSISPQETLDKLKAAGVKAEFSNPAFALTHEKGMVIDGTTAYIMTSNFTNAALGTGSHTKNREYDIVDTNPQDVQAVATIFQADWNRTTPSFNDPNLVVSPVNARSDFDTLIGSARHTLLVTGEEMNDSGIEQDLVNAAQHGVKVQVILPTPSGSSDSNSNGIATIEQGGVQVREDPVLYMHAKIIVVDGKEAFVGSQNISTQSLDQNREVGILVSDPNVLNTLQQTFQTDWNQSKGV